MDEEAPSDDVLVRCCRQGLPYGTDHFETLVNRYKNRVFRKIYSMLQNREDAEDVAQEVFLKIFRGLPLFKGEARFSTWLYAVTVNTTLNFRDKADRKFWWWLTEGIDENRRAAREEEEIFDAVIASIEKSDQKDRVERALDGIGVRHREIIILRYFDECDYRTLSKRLDIGLSAAKMRLKRAREAFKSQYLAQKRQGETE